MKYILKLVLLFFIIIIGCKTSNSGDDLVNRLKKDKNFLQYMAYDTQIKTNMLINKYNFRNANRDSLKNKLKFAKSSSEILSAYETSGVTNAKEYIMLSYTSALYFNELKKNYPSLFNISIDERQKIFESAYPEKTEKIKNTIEKLNLIVRP